MYKTIKELGIYISDGNYSSKYPRSEEFVSEGIPFIRGNNMLDGEIIDEEMYHITSEKHSVLLKGHVKTGDVLITTRGNIGQVAIVPNRHEDSNINAQIVLLRVNPNELYNRYLLWVLQSQKAKEQYEALQTGTALKQLPVGKLEQVKIKYVDLEKQYYIADVLDKVYQIVRERRKELEELDNLIKSRFVEMFDEGKYPKVPIGDLVLRKVSTAKKDFEQTDLIKYIDISSIDNKRNVMTGYTEYIMSEAPSRAQQHIKKGDIVVSTVRPNLKNVAITEFDDDNLVASSGFCVLRAIKCLPAYLMAIVSSDNFTDAMTKVVTGANYPAIKDSDVLGYEVPLPPMELQEQFAIFVNQVDKLKFEVHKSLEETQTLMDSLMQQYFG